MKLNSLVRTHEAGCALLPDDIVFIFVPFCVSVLTRGYDYNPKNLGCNRLMGIDSVMDSH